MYRPSDFSKMYFKVHGVFDLASVPELDEVPLFKKVRSNRDKTIRYFCYMYDHNSPVVRRIRDIDKRKRDAATLAQFDLEEDAQYLGTLHNLSIPLYENIVMEMLRAQHNRDFTTIITYEKVFEECMNKAWQEVDMEKDTDALRAMDYKIKMVEKMHEISEKIAALEVKIFAGSEQVKDIVERSGALRPHDVARRMRHVQ